MHKLQFRRSYLYLVILALFMSASTADIISKEEKSVVTYNTTYTHTTKETCNQDNICTLQLYSATQFGYEDNTWKNLSQLRSFINSTNITCKVTRDGGLNAQCLDYNATAIKVRLLPLDSEILKSPTIPVRVIEKEYIETNDILTIQETEKSSIPIDFSTEKVQERWIPIKLGQELHFGEDSTLIELQDADTENLDDTQLSSQYPTNSYGASNVISMVNGSGYLKHTLTKFQLGNLSGNVIEANFTIYISGNGLDDATEGWETTVYLAYNNYSWTEATVNYNTRPDESTQIGEPGQTITFVGGAGEQIHFTTFDSTDALQYAFDNSYENVTLYLFSHDSYGSPSNADMVSYFTKEYLTNTSLRPMLSILYGDPPTPDACNCTFPSDGSNFEIDLSCHCNTTTTFDIGTLTFNSTGWWACNHTGTIDTWPDHAANQITYIQPSCTITT